MRVTITNFDITQFPTVEVEHDGNPEGAAQAYLKVIDMLQKDWESKHPEPMKSKKEGTTDATNG